MLGVKESAYNRNSFYKNTNSSVSSTDLVATDRFTKVLLEKEAPYENGRGSDNIPKSPTKANAVKKNEPTSYNNRAPTSRNNAFLSKLSMFENQVSTGPTVLRRNDIGLRVKQASSNFKPSTYQDGKTGSNQTASASTKLKSAYRPDYFSNKENLSDTEFKAHKLKSSKFFPVKIEPSVEDFELKKSFKKEPDFSKDQRSFVEHSQSNKSKNNNKNQKSFNNHSQLKINNKDQRSFAENSQQLKNNLSVEDSTQPIATCLFLSSPDHSTVSVSSVLTPPRLSKPRHPISTAFSHDPIYGSKSLSRNISLPRTSTLNSIGSEKPLFDKTLSSSASIAGSMLSERPLFDVTSEHINDDETLYRGDKSKSSNSIISESIFETHELVSSSISEHDNSSKWHETPLPRKESVDHKLNEFSYLFDESIGRVIASSLVKSNLDEVARRSMVVPDFPNVTDIPNKTNNTVRFNEEITEYDHPEISSEEETTIGGLRPEDPETTVDLSSSFNQSITSTVVKRAINAARSPRQSVNSSRTSINYSKISSGLFSELYQTDFRTFESSRRRSRSRNSYKNSPDHLKSRKNASFSHLPLNTAENSSSTSFFRRFSLKGKAHLKKENAGNPTHSNASIERPNSVMSSRASFATSRLHRKFSSAFSSRRNSGDFENQLPDTPADVMNNPLYQDAVNDLQAVYGEHGDHKSRSSRRSVKSVGSHFIKNLSALSLSKSKEDVSHVRSCENNNSSQQQTKGNSTSFATIIFSKLTTWF